ncbi:c-type cytochrome [Acidobacteria bacterium AB60]|nr:c-type cytochrome [Acidobacteria bacterium AB60]
MKALPLFASLGLSGALLLCACQMPGKPRPEPEVPRPEAILSFDRLYAENCSACHGAQGENGSAAQLANPEYQALVDDATLRDRIDKGFKGTLMPAFGMASGGELTEQQIDVLVKGMRQRWRKPNAFGSDTPPPYIGTHPGDASKGEQVYATACASCHGPDAQHPGKNGPILDGSFLALINEQTIRTTLIAGRTDIGQPDWRNDVPGHPLSDDDISNVSAWLIAQRPRLPGQPYPNLFPTSQLPAEKQPSSVTPAQR